MWFCWGVVLFGYRLGSPWGRCGITGGALGIIGEVFGRVLGMGWHGFEMDLVWCVGGTGKVGDTVTL